MIECAHCLVEDKRVTAINWCMECQEPICSECTKSHKLFSGLKTHQISKLLCTPQVDVLDVSEKLCKKHPWTELDFFCKSHDEICCRICLTTEHERCTEIQSLESASIQIKQSALFTDCNDKLTAISKCIDGLLQSHMKKCNDFQNDDKGIQNAIREIAKRLKLKIQQTEEIMLNQLKTFTDQQYLNLHMEKESVLKKKVELEMYKNRMNFAHKHAPNKQSFFFIRDLTQNLMRTENELEKLIQSLSNKTSLSFDQSNVVYLSELLTFGTINVMSVTCPIVTYISSKQQAQAPQQTPDKSDALTLSKVNTGRNVIEFEDISRLIITDDEKIVWCKTKKELVCILNSYVRYGDPDYKEVKINAEPKDITIIPGTNKAVVTVGCAFIQFIDITVSVPQNKIDVTSMLKNSKDGVSAIGSTKEKILVGGKGIICILNTEGQLQSTLELCCGIISSIHVGNDTNYYISELSKCYCIKPSGKTVFTYRIAGEQTHVAIKTDLTGNVYVMGRDTNTIERLYASGFFNCRFLGKENGINEPVGMCFNKSCDKLYVANANEIVFLSHPWNAKYTLEPFEPFEYRWTGGLLNRWLK